MDHKAEERIKKWEESNIVFVIIHFVQGEKQIAKVAFSNQEAAILYCQRNGLESWHLYQMEVLDAVGI